MADEAEVVHGVVALHATTVGDELHIDLYGGNLPVCASVRFTFSDPRHRRAMQRRMQRWTRAATPLTLVRIGRSVTLSAL